MSSNNNPVTVASLLVDAVEEFCVPKRVTADCGTENGIIAAAQTFLRRYDEHNTTPHVWFITS